MNDVDGLDKLANSIYIVHGPFEIYIWYSSTLELLLPPQQTPEDSFDCIRRLLPGLESRNELLLL